MNIKAFIKVPFVLLENIFFLIFPNSREIIEKSIYNPYEFNKEHLEYSKKQFDNFLEKIGGKNALKDKTLLELGPGGSIGFGLLAMKYGAKKYYAIENGQHSFITNSQIRAYEKLLNYDKVLLEKIFIKKAATFTYNPDFIKFIEINQNSKYVIPDNSIDLIYSCAVLEHVHNLELCFEQMTRVLKVGGVMNHQVDLRDHIFSQKSLWFLGISNFWFKTLFSKTGEYVNRKRLSFYKKLARKHCLEITNLKKDIIFKKSFADKLLKEYSENDLRTASFNIILTKK